jgi:hypothetical protein
MSVRVYEWIKGLSVILICAFIIRPFVTFGIDLGEIELASVAWIHLAQYRD